MKKALKSAATAVLILFTFIGCSKDSGGGTNNTTVNCSTVTNKAFASDVSPIIQTVCAVAGCHATGSANGPGALTNYTQVFNARTLIRSAVSSGAMPQGSTLSSAQKNSIICWIDSGAPNN
jgi:hypothetical protein